MTGHELVTALQYLGYSPSSARWYLSHVNAHGGSNYSVWRGNEIIARVSKTPRKREYTLTYGGKPRN